MKEATGGRGVDFVLDMVGGAYLERNVKCLADDGTLCIIGLLGGPRAKSAPLHQVMLRRLTVTGSTLRARSAEVKGQLARELHGPVWSWIASGRYRPVVTVEVPLTADGVREAHAALEAGDVIGKAVINVDG